jgi:hypothetical protein
VTDLFLWRRSVVLFLKRHGGVGWLFGQVRWREGGCPRRGPTS